MLEECEIFVNKNTVPGDTSAMKPSGIRIGTCAITTMGMKEEDMSVVATFIHLIIKGETFINRNSVIEYVKQRKEVLAKEIAFNKEVTGC
jgi:glycine hydroxymethyltransferase